MYNKVFISHSKDDPNIDFFHRIFSGLNTKTVWMEYENITPPPSLSIRNEINQSDALFVILNNYLINRQHTGNWVAFEIGLAANRPFFQLLPFVAPGIDVYVFEPVDNPINFAVPYCNYYMLYNPSNVEQLKFLKELVERAPYHYKGIPVKCPYPNCQIEFKLLSDIDTHQFNCPACRSGIKYSTTTRTY